MATCRNPEKADELQELCRSSESDFSIIELDVTDSSSIESAEKQIPEFDILINNAGIIESDESIDTLDFQAMLQVFSVNSVAPMIVTKNLLGKIRKNSDSRIVNISSKSGSISRVRAFNNLYSYKASKTALNMMTRILSFELKESNIPVIALSPGWVRTDMGGDKADLSKEESAWMMMDVIEKISIEDSGKFLNYNGETCQW